MANAYIPVDQVVNDYIIAMQEDDYASNVSDYQLRQYALRGIREFGMDIAANIKSTLLDVNEQYGYVEIPCDLLALTKIGQLGSDGLVYVFAENKNMNLLKMYPTICWDLTRTCSATSSLKTPLVVSTGWAAVKVLVSTA